MAARQLTLSEKLTQQSAFLERQRMRLERTIDEISTTVITAEQRRELSKRLNLAKEYKNTVQSLQSTIQDTLQVVRGTDLGDTPLAPTEPKKEEKVITIEEVLENIERQRQLRQITPVVPITELIKPSPKPKTKPRLPRKQPPGLANNVLAQFIADIYSSVDMSMQNAQYDETQGIFVSREDIEEEQQQDETTLRRNVITLITSIMKDLDSNPERIDVVLNELITSTDRRTQIAHARWVIENANRAALRVLTRDSREIVTKSALRLSTTLYTRYREIAQQLPTYYFLLLTPGLIANKAYGSIAIAALAYNFSNHLNTEELLENLMNAAVAQSTIPNTFTGRNDVKGFIRTSLGALLTVIEGVLKNMTKPQEGTLNADGTPVRNAFGAILGFLGTSIKTAGSVGSSVVTTLLTNLPTVLDRLAEAGKDIRQQPPPTVQEEEVTLEDDVLQFADGADYNLTTGTLTVNGVRYAVGKPKSGDPRILQDLYETERLSDRFAETSNPDNHHSSDYLAITYAVNVLPEKLKDSEFMNTYRVDDVLDLLAKLSFGYYWEQGSPVQTARRRFYSINISNKNDSDDRTAINDLLITYVVAVTAVLEYLPTLAAAKADRKLQVINEIYRQYWVAGAAKPNRGSYEENVPYAFHSGIEGDGTFSFPGVNPRSVAEALQIITRKPHSANFYNPVEQLSEDSVFSRRWTALNQEMPQQSWKVGEAGTQQRFPVWFSWTLVDTARKLMGKEIFSVKSNITVPFSMEAYRYLAGAARPNKKSGRGLAIWKVGNRAGLTGDTGLVVESGKPPPQPSRAGYGVSECGSCHKEKGSSALVLRQEMEGEGYGETIHFWVDLLRKLNQLAKSGSADEIELELNEITNKAKRDAILFMDDEDIKLQSQIIRNIISKLDERDIYVTRKKNLVDNMLAMVQQFEISAVQQQQEDVFDPILVTPAKRVHKMSEVKWSTVLDRLSDIANSGTLEELEREVGAILDKYRDFTLSFTDDEDIWKQRQRMIDIIEKLKSRELIRIPYVTQLAENMKLLTERFNMDAVLQLSTRNYSYIMEFEEWYKFFDSDAHVSRARRYETSTLVLSDIEWSKALDALEIAVFEGLETRKDTRSFIQRALSAILSKSTDRVMLRFAGNYDIYQQRERLIKIVKKLKETRLITISDKTYLRKAIEDLVDNFNRDAEQQMVGEYPYITEFIEWVDIPEGGLMSESVKRVDIPRSTSNYKLVTGKGWHENLTALKDVATSGTACDLENILGELIKKADRLSFEDHCPFELKPMFDSIEQTVQDRDLLNDSTQEKLLTIREKFEEAAIENRMSMSGAHGGGHGDDGYYDSCPSSTEEEEEEEEPACPKPSSSHEKMCWPDYKQLMSNAVIGYGEKSLSDVLKEAAQQAEKRKGEFYKSTPQEHVHSFMHDDVMNIAIAVGSWDHDSMKPHVDVIISCAKK